MTSKKNLFIFLISLLPFFNLLYSAIDMAIRYSVIKIQLLALILVMSIAYAFFLYVRQNRTTEQKLKYNDIALISVGFSYLAVRMFSSFASEHPTLLFQSPSFIIISVIFIALIPVFFIKNNAISKENKKNTIEFKYQNSKLQQLTQEVTKIAELEAEKQNPKKPEPLIENYNPTERGTHLQAIAILAIREAERNPTGLMTNTGKIKNSSIADILAKEAKTLFTNPRDKDAFRRRLAEALKTYSSQAE